MMKNTLIALLLMYFLMGAYSLCPSRCSSCANSTSCTTCQAGYFLVNQTSCPQCPPGCTACSAGGDGRPVCTACAAPAQLAAGKCFVCDPSCETCTGSPGNCVTCPAGKILRTRADSTKQCINDATCPIPNCVTCTTLSQFPNYTQCSSCKPGFFNAEKRCGPCPFPCTSCNFDGGVFFSTVIRPFWQAVVQTARTDNLLPNPQPPFIAWLQGSDTSDGWSIRNWIKAHVVYLSIEAFFPANFNNSQLMRGAIEFLPNFTNLNPIQINDKIMEKLRTSFNLNWTTDQFYQRFDKIIASMLTCGSCAPGYKLDSGTGKCVPCPPNCLLCNNGPCTECQPKYFVSVDACQKCTSPCDTCSTSATTCTSCISPASLDAGTSTCLLCAQPCLTCQPGALTSCLKCKQPYSIDANPTNNSCYRCDQDLCVKCVHDNTAACLECKPGTTLNAGLCEQCSITNCAECSAGATAVCYRCKVGFSLVNQTTCAPCGPGCLRCSDTNPNVCLACDAGLFINTTTGQCRKCKQGCLECTDAESCSKFADGIVYIGDRRVPCRPGCKVCPTDRPDQCTTCEERFFIDQTNLVCKSCEPGCLECSDATTCTKCLNNLHLVSANCVPCQGNCRTCDSANLATCYTCKKGYSLVSGACVHLCQTGCLECDSTDSNICKKCAQGHALTTDGKCLKCLGSCSGSCDPKNINICLGCVNGFELLNNKCVRCPFGCLTCLNGQCSQCAKEFKLTETSTGFVCRERCKFPCLTCSGPTCSACQAGFKIVNGVCAPDFSCNPNCDFCPPGTFKNTAGNNQCVACTTNCATCTTNSDCSQCLDGFYLNAATCTACPAQCQTCFDGTSCKTCSPGYTKQIVSMGTDVSDAVYSDKCIACDPNCRTCTVEPDRCTSCPEGFRLFSFRCAGMFTVGYIYQLATAYSTFLTSGQSQRFIQAIAQILGIDLKDNYITSLSEGSTVIGGTASATSQGSATAMSSSLTGSVSGYSVVSFSSSVYYGDSKVEEEVKENKPNVGLIVGVVLGSVALIAIIAVIVYKKMKAAASAPVTVKDSRVESTELKDQKNNQISYAEEK